MKLLSPSEKKKIIAQLREQYGIHTLQGQILQFGKEKLKFFTGNLSKETLMQLDNALRIEDAGLYLSKKEHTNIRLNTDALFLFENQITKNIIDLTDEQFKEWMKGYNLDIQSDKAFKVLRYRHMFIGCGKSSGERISNFLPKEKRIKD